ncbi:TH1 protein [Phycomyces nitens]|nr:TH1 protein [Phycomyces nitens]
MSLATLEDYRKVFIKEDAILEPNVYSDGLLGYLNKGGAPMDAVTTLSESYVGIPSMCNVTAESAAAIGIDTTGIMQAALKTLLIKQFNPVVFDNFFMTSENHVDPAWLQSLVDDASFRQTAYKLLELHPRCAFLNLIVLKAAESGYRNEISSLKTSSTYLLIYNQILEESLNKFIGMDDLAVEENLPDLVRVCCEREETYMYAQMVLYKLREEYNGQPLTRLIAELEKAASKHGRQSFVDILRVSLSDAPRPLSAAIKAILATKQLTAGDIRTIHSMYYTSVPPPVHHICRFDLLEILLKAVYVPDSEPQLRSDTIDQVIFLISFAVTVKDTDNKPQSETHEVAGILKNLHVALKERSKGADFSGAMEAILTAIRLPVGSMAVLMWVEYISINTAYYENYYRTTEIPLPHLLLDEIADRHPLQQPFVFKVIKRCLVYRYQNFAPEILMVLQKTWVDRLLYLVQLNYTTPVLDYMKGDGQELDDSLTVHFIEKVLNMCQPPYSTVFVQSITEIVERIKVTLHLLKDVEARVTLFFEQAKKEGTVW